MKLFFIGVNEDMIFKRRFAKLYQCILSVIVFFLSASIVQTVAAEDAYFYDNTLFVPVIDVPNAGRLEAEFRLLPDGYDFELKKLVSSSKQSIAPAIFAADTAKLKIPSVDIRFNGSKYSMELDLLPGVTPYTFRLVSVTELASGGGGQSSIGQSEYENQCLSCHGAAGTGTPSGTSLVGCATCSDTAALSNYILLNMPIGGDGPETCGTSCASNTAKYILEAFNGAKFDQAAVAIQGVNELDALHTLRKAMLNLSGRAPTDTELNQVMAEDMEGLRSLLDTVMTEEAFLYRLMEIFNDTLLTDKYLSSNRSEGAIQLLSRDDYPDRRWFDTDPRPENYSELRRATNDGIAREPLELIKYIVRNNRPYTEVLTADYVMMNPHSAKSYGATGVTFADASDENEFQPGKIPAIPTAGLLTSHMFMNRFPTTATNRNRHRSRKVFEIFLDTDILSIEGSRPEDAVDLTSINPTLDNPSCYSCHTVMDPVASIFQNWDDDGRFRPTSLPETDNWYQDMDVRGFAGVIMPLRGNIDKSVQWLAKEMVKDPRFARATVKTLFEGITGSEVLSVPVSGLRASAAETTAYLAQRKVLSDIEKKLVADNWNLKTAIKEIVLSPYFRANGLQVSADTNVHAKTGSARLLTPEMLNRKIISLLGFEWKRRLDYKNRDRDNTRASRLGHNEYYKQLYGGIDSDQVTKRLTQPNGLIVAVQERMASELACYAVPEDFRLSRDKRKLFRYVARDTSPLDGDGQLVQSSVDSIKQNIQYLHAYLLGELLPLDDPEINATYGLFFEAYYHGQQPGINDTSSKRALQSECRRNNDSETGESLDHRKTDGADGRVIYDDKYTIRSWMAVVTYLLSDYRFVYE